ncbi:MAG: serine/threonine protein kinase, partial [Deltaproteobacteria bacterium]|nr:serine/threonine protein kinase [Deltaproteobacteria bacterium]
LGKGAMGEVWRARDERLDRYVALKVLPPDAAGDPERRMRMLREAKAAAAIRHANVVTLFDILTHEGEGHLTETFLVMELVDGRTLSDVLRKDGATSLERAMRWTFGIADALVTAHAKGILHRDIKAANVMVTDADDVKLLDFGLAKLMREQDAIATLPLKKPSASLDRIALDETMPSSPTTSDELDSYKTHAGQLIGTPLYMAPEQIDGATPDERSEVFSVGVLAHEMLAGKPPYTATSMDELFRQIQTDTPPALDVPEPVQAILNKALEKDPAARYASMTEFRDAIAAERTRLFAPKARRWPLYVALAVILVGAVAGIYLWRANQITPARPGDKEVARALEEYELFSNDKAMSSLRAALRIAPNHARANAYVLLLGFSGFASDADRTAAVAAGKAALPDATGNDKRLLEAALALTERGPKAAEPILAGTNDRELRFWKAELDYRAGSFEAAAAGYKRLLADGTQRLRGRIYDHYSFILLALDDTAEAKRIGTLYRDAFPGEADAIGVYATTLSAAGEHEAAIVAAEEALRLAEGEDTFAGLAKVLAHEGDRVRAKELYQRSLERAGAGRRPLRRAALAMLQLVDGDLATAKETVKPCLAGGSDSTVRERGACLFVAGILDPTSAAAQQLDALAMEATDLRPPYGQPSSLARMVRARAQFFGGGCVTTITDGTPPADDSAYRAPLDFYAAYHVPFFATWATCERAAILATKDKAAARALLEPIAKNRWWIEQVLARYR